MFEEDSKPLADIAYSLIMNEKRTFGKTDYGGKTTLKVDDNDEQKQVTPEQPLCVKIE